jgi:hypothetical protein
MPPDEGVRFARERGYTESEIAAWAAGKRGAWRDAGYADEEIEKALSPPDRAPTSRVPAPPAPPASNVALAQQRALERASRIADPAERLGVMRVIRQEAQNELLMEGVTNHAREQEEKKAAGMYIQAMDEILNDTKAKPEEKAAIAVQLKRTAGQDPRLAWGMSGYQLQKALQDMVQGGEEGYGNGFEDVMKGIYNGTVTSPSQILQMQNDKTLTVKGMQTAYQTFEHINQPQIKAQTQKTIDVIEHIKKLTYGDGTEENPMTNGGRPQVSKRQLEMFTAWKTKFMDGIGALKGDIKELDKYLNLDEVKKNFEKFYPKAERDYDWLTRGQNRNLAKEIPVPSDIPVGKEQEYRWVVGAPPTYLDVNAKQQPSTVARYAKAIARLRANPTDAEKELFEQAFPHADANHILQLFGPSPTHTPGAVPYLPPAAPAAPAAPSPYEDYAPHRLLQRGFGALFHPTEMTPAEARERERETE